MVKEYKVGFFDLDDTLITTASGETFPAGIWDIRFKLDVLDAIKGMKLERVVIVSNQGGIGEGLVNGRSFKTKMNFVSQAVSDYTNSICNAYYCESNKKDDPYRKPNTGMIEHFMSSHPEYKMEDCFMVGDASGKPGDFNDTDLKTARNAGLDYFDVRDFVEKCKK